MAQISTLRLRARGAAAPASGGGRGSGRRWPDGWRRPSDSRRRPPSAACAPRARAASRATAQSTASPSMPSRNRSGFSSAAIPRARAAPARVGILEHQVADLVEPSGQRRLAGALPVAQRAAAVPGTGREAQHLAGHAGLFQRAREHVDQHGHGFDVLLHRARAVDQEGQHAVGLRLHTLAAEQASLGRRRDQLRQAPAVDPAFFLRAVPAVVRGRGQQRLQLARQPRQVQALRGDPTVELLAVLAAAPRRAPVPWPRSSRS